MNRTTNTREPIFTVSVEGDRIKEVDPRYRAYLSGSRTIIKIPAVNKRRAKTVVYQMLANAVITDCC